MTRLDRWLPLILFSVPLTWAGSFIAGKVVVAEIDPLSSVFWRFALSAAVIMPVLAAWHRTARPKLTDPGFLRHLAIVVVVSGVVYHVLFFWGLAHASPTNAALIITLNPFFTTLGDALILKRPRGPRFYVGFAMAFSGAAWVILGRGGGLALPGLGELICLAASISWSAYTLAAKATNDGRWDALWVNGYSYILTSLAVLPFVWTALHRQLTEGLSTGAWLGSWYMAIFPTAIGYTVYYIGVQRRGPAWTASYIYLIPPLAAVLDLVFFGARITVPLVAGTVMVVCGLVVGLKGPASQRGEETKR